MQYCTNESNTDQNLSHLLPFESVHSYSQFMASKEALKLAELCTSIKTHWACKTFKIPFRKCSELFSTKEAHLTKPSVSTEIRLKWACLKAICSTVCDIVLGCFQASLGSGLQLQKVREIPCLHSPPYIGGKVRSVNLLLAIPTSVDHS